MKLTVTLTGVRDMLQHNGRLANPLDEHTRRIASISKKRTKTDADHYDLYRLESRGACWETPEGLLGVPTAAVWRSIYDASKAFKLGEDVKRALNFEDATQPLLVDGDEISCDDFLARDGSIDYRPVRVQSNRTMRARPRIPAGWQTTHSFELFEDVVDPERLVPVFVRAGRLVGVGDWRPVFGLYEAEVSNDD